MIKLFVLDVDGCLAYPFHTPEWELLTEIRKLQSESHTDPAVPELTLCTGRPFPYAEAVAQFLGIRRPFLFESGGGLFDPDRHRFLWSPAYDAIMEEKIRELRSRVVRDILPDYEGVDLEFSKKTDVGMVSADQQQIRQIYRRLSPVIEAEYEDFELHCTEVSVNIIMKASNKGSGLEHLSSYSRIPLKEMGYIGDSSGDLSALNAAGKSFAPANAIDEVKRTARVMGGPATEGVLQAYRLLIRENRQLEEVRR